MKGKTKLPEIEMDFRNTARAVLKKLDIEEEYQEQLSMSGNKSPRDSEVKEVADIRFSLAVEIKKIIDDLVASKDKQEKLRLKDAQKNLMDEFMSLPDLGSTFDEWENELKNGTINRSVGRPPIPFEVNLLRAREHADKSMKNYINLSNRLGNPESMFDSELRHPISENEMLELYSKITENMGKDSKGDLGVIDAEIKKLDAKIHHITSGEAQKEREEKLSHATYSSNGIRRGRPFEPLEKLLERYEGEKKELEVKREALESKLPPIEKMGRRIQVEEDKLRDLRRLIRSEGWDPRKDDRDEMPYGKMLSDIESLIVRLKSLKKTAENGSDKALKDRAEREIKSRYVMQEELDRQHKRDEAIRRGISSKNDLQEGVDQLMKEIVGM